MSWRASAWAKEQRLGSPAAKSILLCLADYADPEKAQCWPSQAQLAADAEVSERTAREWLQRLEEWGLICRQRRSRDNGARATDMIVLNLSAKVLDGAEKCRNLKGCEADEDASLPAEIAGRTLPAADAEPTGNERTPTGNQFRASIEEPSNGTSQGTSQPGAQARERGEEGEEGKAGEPAWDRKAIDAAYWRLVKDWPGFAGMPKEPARRVFAELSAQDRADAAARFPGWLALLKAQGKDRVPAPSTYLRERLWTSVPDPVEAAKAAQGPRLAKPFGPQWSELVFKGLIAGPVEVGEPPITRESRAGSYAHMRDMLGAEVAETRYRAMGHEIGEGGELLFPDDFEARIWRQHVAENGFPKVKRLYEAAAKGLSVALGDGFVESGAAFEPVPVGLKTWEAWKAAFEARGWPFMPPTGKQPVVYFPAGGPDGLSAFERVLTAASEGKGHHADGDRQAAE